MTIEFRIERYIEPYAKLDFYDKNTREYQYSIVEQDRVCNHLDESTDYNKKYLRNVSIQDGEFDGIVIMVDVSSTMIDQLMIAIATEITNSGKFRTFVRNCMLRKLVYPDGILIDIYSITIEPELLA